MSIEEGPPTRGRRIFNVFSAIVLFLFALFCLGMAVGVASIPKLREAAERIPS
jgi:hypothetical protein